MKNFEEKEAWGVSRDTGKATDFKFSGQYIQTVHPNKSP